MRKTTLTILLVAAVVAIWRRSPTRKPRSGNVAEMVAERGIAYGGSFLAPGYDIRIDSEKPYDAPSPLIGFRVIAVKKS